jgi:uncharacterized protein
MDSLTHLRTATETKLLKSRICGRSGSARKFSILEVLSCTEGVTIMSGETDLTILLESMQPIHQPGEFVFCAIAHPDSSSFNLNLNPICTFREAEALTLILQRQQADAAQLPYESVFGMITLSVHSSLQAVGFIAAIASRLAEKGISVNPVSAYYHDHLFVAIDRVDDALEILHSIVRNL